MTEVYLEKDGGSYIVSAKGHATGSVELCAAISILVYALIVWVRSSDALVFQEETESGNALVDYCVKPKDRESGQTVFDFLTGAFLQLEKQYPDKIRVDRKIIS